MDFVNACRLPTDVKCWPAVAPKAGQSFRFLTNRGESKESMGVWEYGSVKTNINSKSVNRQRSTANGQPPTVNRQQSTANSQPNYSFQYTKMFRPGHPGLVIFDPPNDRKKTIFAGQIRTAKEPETN